MAVCSECESILDFDIDEIDEGDVTIACWEPGQVSPNHCHPFATEIYFCFEGGGTMLTLSRTRSTPASASM